MAVDSRDQQIADLERELHRLRIALQQADAQARTWRRIAQWIHDAHRSEGP